MFGQIGSIKTKLVNFDAEAHKSDIAWGGVKNILSMGVEWALSSLLLAHLLIVSRF